MNDADIERLTDEITTLCGHLDAAEFRLLELIRTLDQAAPWGRWHLKSCAHWLNWRCGIALGAAREKVRVANALPPLPRVSEAFREGRLSYSKVRAITRVATPDNEDRWVTMAVDATAAQIETLARHGRRIERRRAAAEAMTQHQGRALCAYWDEDGMLVLKGRLPPEQGALLLKALERAADALDFDQDLPRPARDSDALVRLAEQFLAAPPDLGEGAASGDRFLVTVHVAAETLRADGEIDDADPPAVEHGPVLAPDTVRRLACEAAVVPLIESGAGEPLALGRKTRAITPALRRALARRDRGCRFPGCSNTRFVDAHHIRHWADGGETRLDNLVLLCRQHHRLIHEGGFTLSGTGQAIAVHDPAGQRVPGTGETRFRGNVGALFAAHEDAGIAIDAHTAAPRCINPRPDYPLVLGLLYPAVPMVNDAVT